MSAVDNEWRCWTADIEEAEAHLAEKTRDWASALQPIGIARSDLRSMLSRCMEYAIDAKAHAAPATIPLRLGGRPLQIDYLSVVGLSKRMGRLDYAFKSTREPCLLARASPRL